MKKRIFAICLAAILAAQMTGITAFAKEEAGNNTVTSAENGEGCAFSFSASQYVLSEAEGCYDITVKRNGSNDFPADVAVKLIDIQAEYGVDYLIYDEDGNQLEVTSGLEVFSSDEDMLDAFESAQDDTSTDEAAESLMPDTGTDENIAADITTASAARAALFGMDTDDITKAEAKQEEDTIVKSLEAMYDGLNEAEGVLCRVSFDRAETEKTFTIEIIDNDQPQSDRVVLMALMAASEGSIAANGTAVLTIEDDEEYEKPIISVESDVTANPKTGTAEVVLKRETGVNYYTSVNAYTYSESAVADEDFVPIDGEQIGFLPGETEKTIEVQVKDFSSDAQFGLRIEPDSTCGVAADADRAVIYIESDYLADNEETVVTNIYEQEEIQSFVSEPTFVELQNLSENTYIGNPYTEIGADEWVAGPYTTIQQDANGNRWAVGSSGQASVLVSKEIENASRAIDSVVLTDEKRLILPPTDHTTTQIVLTSKGNGDLEKNLKHILNSPWSISTSELFRSSNAGEEYWVRPSFDYLQRYTPNIVGNVKFFRLESGQQFYPKGLKVSKYDSIMPLLPMKIYYRKYTVRAYSSNDKFTDIRYDLADGKYTEKPILDSEYTPLRCTFTMTTETS